MLKKSLLRKMLPLIVLKLFYIYKFTSNSCKYVKCLKSDPDLGKKED